MKRLALALFCVMVALTGVKVLAVEDTPRIPGGHAFIFLRDSFGSEDMNVDGSIVPVNFDFVVPANTWIDLYGLNFVIENAMITPQSFGGLPPLPNGIAIQLLAADLDAVLQDVTVEGVLNSISDFGFLNGMSISILRASPPADVFIGSWNLEDTGAAFRLLSGQKVRVVVQDDLTGLSSFSVMVQGIFR